MEEERRGGERAGQSESVKWWIGKLTEESAGLLMGEKEISEVAGQWGRRWADLESRSIRDPLTGALSRGAITEVLEHLLDTIPVSEHSLGVAMLDLDRFSRLAKPENSQDLSTKERLLAEERADLVIVDFFKLVGEVAEEKSREAGGEVWKGLEIGRPGGEEMLLVVPHLPAGEAGKERFTQMMEVIRQRLESDLQVRNKLAEPLTVSSGLVTVEGGIGRERIISACDRALAEAKEAGRNRLVMGQIEPGAEWMPDQAAEGERAAWLGKEEETREAELAADLEDWLGGLTDDESGKIERQQLQPVIEELAGMFDELEQNELWDHLTHSYKRGPGGKVAGELLAAEFAHRRPVGMVVLNIDAFKEVNSAEGHDGGDRVLAGCVDLVEETVKAMEVEDYLIIRRRPGGEFILLVTGTGQEQIGQLAKQISDTQGRLLAGRAGLARLESVSVTAAGGLLQATDIRPGQAEARMMEERAEEWLGKAKRDRLPNAAE